MNVIATIVCALLSLFIGLFVFLAGTSYQIMLHVPNAGLDVYAWTFHLFGHELKLWHFDPMGAVRYAVDSGILGFDGFSNEVLMMLAIGALVWIVLLIISSRIMTLFANKKTDIHGSSRWATDREMKGMGLLKGTGVVLGQTAKAKYISVRPKKPKRKKGESRADYRTRLVSFNPAKKEMAFVKEGEVISQATNAHTLIVGSTRSGKGVSCIIPTEFRWGESLIVLDPKAEGWDISANYRARFSYTFKFQPEKPDESVHYNPLLSIRRGKQAIPDIQNLAYILIPSNPGAKDPFWDNEARKLFAAAVGYVIYCEEPKKKTFAQVYSIFSNSEALQNLPQKTADGRDIDPQMSAVKKYLTHYADKAKNYLATAGAPEHLREKEKRRDTLSEEERKQLDEDMKKYLSEDDKNSLRRIQQDLEYFANCEDKQLSSVVSTMLSQLQVIADPNVQAVTDRSDFTMDDFVMGVPDETGKRHPMSMYICVSLSSMQRLVPLINIFYSQAITLLSRDLDMKRPFRLLLIFDEFRQLGKMDIVERALSLTAGYGILCMIAIQSFDQLRVLYDSEAMFIDNFAYQVVLRVNDEQTSQKIERILGQQTVRHKRTSFSKKRDVLVHDGENITIEDTGRPLMTSDEIRTMGDNECIIIQSGEHPYKGKKIRYYLDDRFRKLYIGKNGKNLPVPLIKDNLPHKQEYEKNNEGEKSEYIGIDGEGWHQLLGADSYELTQKMKTKDEEEAKKEAEEKKKSTAPDPKNAIPAEENVKVSDKGDENAKEPYSDLNEEAEELRRRNLASNILLLWDITREIEADEEFESSIREMAETYDSENAEEIVNELLYRREAGSAR